jgi:hypothetical protein
MEIYIDCHFSSIIENLSLDFSWFLLAWQIAKEIQYFLMQLEFAMWEIGWARLLDLLQQLFMGSG